MTLLWLHHWSMMSINAFKTLCQYAQWCRYHDITNRKCMPRYDITDGVHILEKAAEIYWGPSIKKETDVLQYRHICTIMLLVPVKTWYIKISYCEQFDIFRVCVFTIYNLYTGTKVLVLYYLYVQCELH